MINFKLNNIDDIIEDSIDVGEFEKHSHKGYVFSQWVVIAAPGKGTMRLVKPAKKLLEEHYQVYGYPITAITPRKCVDGTINWIVSCRTTDNTRFPYSSIAGNVKNYLHVVSN